MNKIKLKDNKGKDFEVSDFEDTNDPTLFFEIFDQEVGYCYASLPKEQARRLGEWLIEKSK